MFGPSADAIRLSEGGAGGYLLEPLYGINKNQATPAWCLYSAAMCTGLFALLHVVVDVGGCVRWAAWLRPAGVNPLLAYILPDMVFAALGLAGVTFLEQHLRVGWVAVGRAAVFSALLVVLTGVLTRGGIRPAF